MPQTGRGITGRIRIDSEPGGIERTAGAAVGNVFALRETVRDRNEKPIARRFRRRGYPLAHVVAVCIHHRPAHAAEGVLLFVAPAGIPQSDRRVVLNGSRLLEPPVAQDCRDAVTLLATKLEKTGDLFRHLLGL